jgi:hypothetical protein
LPRLGFFIVALIIFVVRIAVIIVAEIVVIIIVIDVVVVAIIDVKPRGTMKEKGAVGHELGSETGLAFSRFGGGYVDQKWRPQRGQTQN